MQRKKKKREDGRDKLGVSSPHNVCDTDTVLYYIGGGNVLSASTLFASYDGGINAGSALAHSSPRIIAFALKPTRRRRSRGKTKVARVPAG